MSLERRNVKRDYRRYVRQCLGYNPPGLIDRDHARYMGYLTPMSMREWIKACRP